MDLGRVIIAIAIMAGVTIFTRAFPFLFFRKKEMPAVMLFIQQYTPPIIMTILVIYCLKDVKWGSVPHGIPELIAIILVAGLHLWKRNPLISIFGGTAVYMALVQTDIFTKLF